MYYSEYFNNYNRGIQDLSPFGRFLLCKYDDETGYLQTIEKILNPRRERPFKKLVCNLFRFKWETKCLFSKFKFTTEEQWLRFAIKTAKELNCDKVVYYDELLDHYRETVVWTKR